ncbi:MAG: type 1 glutamine amidotransferase [Pirellulales bacterium]|nr:type 1 glutamine amidotransferase [Pirellulales bacterium]
MHLHFFQHVPFEDLANVAVWAGGRGHAIAGTRLFDGEAPPAVDALDVLVVLGGPMNVDQHDEHPWLVEEKRFIAQAIERGKVVLGICLGAQLVARALGAEIRANPFKEIGWFPVALTPAGRASRVFASLPDEFVAFHWHGDTFDLPAGAARLAGSQACANQAFLYGDRVLAIQFHLEYSEASIAAMVGNGAEEFVPGPFIQSPREMVGREDYLARTRAGLMDVLDRLVEATSH